MLKLTEVATFIHEIETEMTHIETKFTLNNSKTNIL